MPRYSFVVPIFNDGYLVDPFCEEFARVMKSYLATEVLDDLVELIFVNDGSSNNSQIQLIEAARNRPFVRIIEFSRNFGHHVAVSCGYRATSGDFVGLINVDMQDPPNQIPALLDHIQSSDCDIVIGIRPERKDGPLRRGVSFLFFTLMNFLTDSNRPANPAVLRIMTRRFVDGFNLLSEQGPYVPGLEDWLGFKHGFVPITHQARTSGGSSYTFIKRLCLAVDAILSFSDFPLKLTAAFGFVCTTVGFVLCAILVIARMMGTHFQPGFTATTSVIVFLGGVQILSIGLLSLYVGRILREVQHRPRFVIKSTVNLPNAPVERG